MRHSGVMRGAEGVSLDQLAYSDVFPASPRVGVRLTQYDVLAGQAVERDVGGVWVALLELDATAQLGALLEGGDGALECCCDGSCGGGRMECQQLGVLPSTRCDCNATHRPCLLVVCCVSS